MKSQRIVASLLFTALRGGRTIPRTDLRDRPHGSKLSFEGVYPILATPFHDDESVDLESMERLIRFMAGLGVDGVTILGVLGEANRMLDREREALIKAAVKAAAGLPVIVGTSHSGTRAALDLSQMAQELGADAVMVTPHAEAVPNEERVFEYYRTIASGIRIPVVLQDHPASSGVHMSAPLMLRIVDELPADRGDEGGSGTHRAQDPYADPGR